MSNERHEFVTRVLDEIGYWLRCAGAWLAGVADLGGGPPHPKPERRQR